MKILAITQARYGSTRLPAKILKVVNGMTLLEIHLRRILQAKTIHQLKIATTDEEGSKYIIDVADKVGVGYYQGSVDDVLSRFYHAAETEKPDYVLRFTSDCPLIDPEVIDMIVNFALQHPEYDYLSADPGSYPDGLDTEVMKFSALKKAYNEARLTSEREHVTPYIWKNGTAAGGTLFKSYKFVNPVGDYSSIRITLDTPEDFELLKKVIEENGIRLGWREYVAYLQKHDEILAINSMFERNEGYAKSLNNDSIIK